MEIAFFNSARSKETQLSYCLITHSKKIWTLHSLIPQSTHFCRIDLHLIIPQLFYPHSLGIKRGVLGLYTILNEAVHFSFGQGQLFSVMKVWRYINTVLKICQYLHLYMKIICRRFHIKTHFAFWFVCTWDMWKVCSPTFRNNRIC